MVTVCDHSCGSVPCTGGASWPLLPAFWQTSVCHCWIFNSAVQWEKSLWLAGKLTESVHKKTTEKEMESPLSLSLRYPWFHPFGIVSHLHLFTSALCNILVVISWLKATLVMVLWKLSCFVVFQVFFFQWFIQPPTPPGGGRVNTVIVLTFTVHKKSS